MPYKDLTGIDFVTFSLVTYIYICWKKKKEEKKPDENRGAIDKKIESKEKKTTDKNCK